MVKERGAVSQTREARRKGCWAVRNVWKGLVIGGLTGAGAGVMIDLLDRGARLVGVTGRKAVDLAPEAAGRVKSAVTGGFAHVQESDLTDALRDHTKEVAHLLDSDTLRDHARDIAHRIGESEQAEQARETVGHARKRGKQAAQAAKDAALAAKDAVPVRSMG